MPATRIPLLIVSLSVRIYSLTKFRCQGFGMAGYKGPFSDPGELQQWINIMVEHDQRAVDTSRLYSFGTSEEVR